VLVAFEQAAVGDDVDPRPEHGAKLVDEADLVEQ
jgi:hypothetical protein